MEGEFLVQEDFGIQKAIGGGGKLGKHHFHLRDLLVASA